MIVSYHRDTAFAERASIREHDGKITKETAERQTAAHEGLMCPECKTHVVVPLGETDCSGCGYVIVRGT